MDDTGGGIDEGKIKSIFKPFTQIDQSSGGLGLGLSIVQRAIGPSHGTVAIENKTDKTGCVFTIDIPKKLIRGPSQKISIPGIDSIQPNMKKEE